MQALASKLVEGVSLTRAQTAIDLLEQLVHVEGMEPVGEIRLVPDPATFTVLPWAPGSASVLCDQLDHDRTDWGACPRSYLKRVLARAAERGLFVQASVENEYYLAREVDGQYVASDLFDHAPVYSADRPRPARRPDPRDGARARRAGDGRRAGDQRVRPRPAGDLDPAHRRAGRRRTTR